MRNFNGSPLDYRKRVRYGAEQAYEEAVERKIKEGGTFGVIQASKLFVDCLDFSALLEDLVLASGLRQTGDDDLEAKETELKYKRREDIRNAISDKQAGDTEGPSGDSGDVNGLRYTEHPADPPSDNGTAGSGEVDTPEQQPPPAITGP